MVPVVVTCNQHMSVMKRASRGFSSTAELHGVDRQTRLASLTICATYVFARVLALYNVATAGDKRAAAATLDLDACLQGGQGQLAADARSRHSAVLARHHADYSYFKQSFKALYYRMSDGV